MNLIPSDSINCSQNNNLEICGIVTFECVSFYIKLQSFKNVLTERKLIKCIPNKIEVIQYVEATGKVSVKKRPTRPIVLFH